MNEHKKQTQYCEFIAGTANCTSAFENILNHFHGFNLCDRCPYEDCVASQTQVNRLQKIEQKYKEDNMPECDKHVCEYRKEMADLWYQQKRNLRRNPTGRKRGRPRKAVAT